MYSLYVVCEFVTRGRCEGVSIARHVFMYMSVCVRL